MEQAPAAPRNGEGQPVATRRNAEGQETTGNPSGQGTTGRKAEGQVTSAGRVVAGQGTAPRHPSRPNR